MTDRTAAEAMCCPGSECQKRIAGANDPRIVCNSKKFIPYVRRLHAAGCMIVPREATKAMVLAAIARPDDAAPEEGLFYHAIYRAMTGAGELK